MNTSRLFRSTAVLALAGSMLAMPAAVATAAPATTGAAGTHAVAAHKKAPKPYRNTCSAKKAALPASVKGDPKVGPGRTTGAAKGLYVWNDGKGWKVRLTHNLPPVAGKATTIEVRGRITATRPITKVRLVRLEDKQRGEWVSVKRPKRKSLDFRFVNGGYIDGINFSAGCAGKVTFTVWQVTKANGKVTRTPLPVFVGAAKTQLTTSTVPALATTPTDVSRFTVLRRPVS